MEKYLKDEYNVYESKYLSNEDKIESHFKDCGSEFFDCGQGYYEDYVELIVKIGDKFYDVSLSAEVYGNKQDVGDKLYFVDHISNVEWEETEKPQPKEKKIYNYSITMNDDQKFTIEHLMNSDNIEFIIKE